MEVEDDEPLQLQEAEDRSSPSSQSVVSSSDSYLVGFIIANIVGLKHYPGTISGREMVGLVREPFNPYDENAIKVLNTRAVQVGHIERTVAAVLSPMIDTNLIAIEGIVPNSRSAGNKFRIPCQVHIFATIESFHAVMDAILGGGLQLISDAHASFTMSEAMAVKETRAWKDFKSVDEIFKFVGANESKKCAWEALEPPKSVIKSELLAHQKEGLGWLFHRENSGELPPFWVEKDGSFVNALTNYETDRKPEPLRGGIFADEMGLGKTLTLLSLIALDKDRGPHNIDEEKHDEMGEQDEGLGVLGGKKGKRGRTNKKPTGSQKGRKSESTHSVDTVKGKYVVVVDSYSTDNKTRATLVVCSASVFSTWITQLEEHTKPGTLKTYMYYGDRRTKNVEELKMYDLVLTTYTTLSGEARGARSNSPLQKLGWWRIILDEAHTIKNDHALQTQAVINFTADRRWAVTGTPIQNGSDDLFSLMAFLSFEPFSIKTYWRSLVQRPIAQGDKAGISRLQVLMATISLRRTKDKALVELSSKTVETYYVKLSWEERELYDRIELEAKSIVQGYINNRSLLRNYSNVLSIILRLRQICTDVALCPSDLMSLFDLCTIEDVSNQPELLQKLVEVLQDGEDFDCPICISPPKDVVITCCAHIFCRSCILRTLQSSKSCCPLCRRPLSESDLFSAPPGSSESKCNRISLSGPRLLSSKVSALVKLLKESGAAKSVVFSQFTRLLLLLEDHLEEIPNLKILRLDGSMNAKQRGRVIEEFGVSRSDGPVVLLASLKASSDGINLTAASRVYLMEPWWNPAVEEQAMARVHRIGQKENVKIVRLIAQDTIDERILQLQEKKKQLATEAFGRRGADRGRVGMDDLRALMSL